MNPKSLQIFILGLLGNDWLSAKEAGRQTEQPNLTCIQLVSTLSPTLNKSLGITTTQEPESSVRERERSAEREGCREWWRESPRGRKRGRAELVGKKAQPGKSDYPGHRLSWPDSTT